MLVLKQLVCMDRAIEEAGRLGLSWVLHMDVDEAFAALDGAAWAETHPNGSDAPELPLWTAHRAGGNHVKARNSEVLV